MTDIERVNKIIDESGIKREKVAADLGMSTASLYNKTHGVTDFTLPEATDFCNYFHIDDPKDRSEIFFVPKVTTSDNASEVIV